MNGPNITREAVALGFVCTLGALVPAAQAGYVGIDDVWLVFADTLWFLAAIASLYIVFGKRVIDSAIDTLQKLRGDE